VEEVVWGSTAVEMDNQKAACREHPKQPLPVRRRENAQNPGQWFFKTPKPTAKFPDCSHSSVHEPPTADPHGGEFAAYCFGFAGL
jgi:hypothetical protein